MLVILRVVTGVLLVAHGLVHLLYLAPDVPEFSIESSRAVPQAWRRPVAVVLMIMTVGAFTLLALAVWGVPGLRDIWPALAVTASAASAVLLATFWNPRLVLGLVIDAALLVVALVRPSWAETLIGRG